MQVSWTTATAIEAATIVQLAREGITDTSALCDAAVAKLVGGEGLRRVNKLKPSGRIVVRTFGAATPPIA
jgi:hypothetical protein